MRKQSFSDKPISSFFSAPAQCWPEISNRPHESTARRKNGDGLPVLLVRIGLAGRIRRWASTVWVFRDITRLKATQNALVAAMQESERANHAKSQFLANMSHELRTPLNAIIGYSEMLVDDARDSGLERMTDDLSRIHTAGRHLLGLIDDVLDLSKIEAGKMDMNSEEFLLQSVIEDVTATVQPLVDEQGNSLTVDCPAHLGPIVSDQMKVRQILYNTSCPTPRNSPVTDRSPSPCGRWRRAVRRLGYDRDRRYGYRHGADQVEKIFGEFIQADSSTTREYGGTGLGLAISRQMVHMLGGQISATSTPNDGSVFFIRLPVSTAAPAVMESDRPEEISAAAQEMPDLAVGPILLVIINDPDELARVARRLTERGFRVVSAKQGQEGLRLARELHPFAILLDSATSDMNGQSVSQRLNADPNTCGIPIIAVPCPSGESIDDEHLFDRLASLVTPAATGSPPIAEEDKLAHIHKMGQNGRTIASGRE